MMTVTAIRSEIAATRRSIGLLFAKGEARWDDTDRVRYAALLSKRETLESVLSVDPGYCPAAAGESLQECQSCERVKSDVSERMDPFRDYDDPKAIVQWCGECFRLSSYAAAD